MARWAAEWVASSIDPSAINIPFPLGRLERLGLGRWLRLWGTAGLSVRSLAIKLGSRDGDITASW